MTLTYDEYRPGTSDFAKAEVDKWLARISPELIEAIPNYMLGGVFRYLIVGVPPGDFLTAVISNNLKEAIARADDTNVFKLADYVRLFYNSAPTGAWGSPQNMKAWVEQGGLAGLFDKPEETDNAED